MFLQNGLPRPKLRTLHHLVPQSPVHVSYCGRLVVCMLFAPYTQLLVGGERVLFIPHLLPHLARGLVDRRQQWMSTEEYGTCSGFSQPGGWNEQGESTALGSCNLLNQTRNKQSMQSQKGTEPRQWSLWRKRCRLRNGSKKSATERRCVSHQKSLKCQNTYGHSHFPNSQKTDVPLSDSCILQVIGPSSQTWQIGPSWEKQVRMREGNKSL